MGAPFEKYASTALETPVSLNVLIAHYERLIENRRLLENLVDRLSSIRDRVANVHTLPITSTAGDEPSSPVPKDTPKKTGGDWKNFSLMAKDRSAGGVRDKKIVVDDKMKKAKAKNCSRAVNKLRRRRSHLLVRVAAVDHHIEHQKRLSLALQRAVDEVTMESAREHWQKVDRRASALLYLNHQMSEDLGLQRYQLIKQLLRVFHVKLEDPKPSLRGFPILSPRDYVNRLNTMSSSELWILGTSLGFFVHLMQLLSTYLDIPLSRRLIMFSSKSFILSCRSSAYLVPCRLRGRLPINNSVKEVDAQQHERENVKETKSMLIPFKSLLEPRLTRLPSTPSLPETLSKRVDKTKKEVDSGSDTKEFDVALRSQISCLEAAFLSLRTKPSSANNQSISHPAVYVATDGVEYSEALAEIETYELEEKPSSQSAVATMGSSLPLSRSSASNNQSRATPFLESRTISDPFNFTLSFLGLGSNTNSTQQPIRELLGKNTPLTDCATENELEGLPLYAKGPVGAGKLQFAVALAALQDVVEQFAAAYEAQHGISQSQGTVALHSSNRNSSLVPATHFSMNQNFVYSKPSKRISQEDFRKQNLFEPVRRVLTWEFERYARMSNVAKSNAETN